jgi:hypothetical protein
VKTPVKVLAAATMLLVLLFLAPIIYRTGQRVAFYLNCPSISYDCWEVAGDAIMHGGRLPRR